MTRKMANQDKRKFQFIEVVLPWEGTLTASKLTEKQTSVLQDLLRSNDNLNLIDVMKEQLQALWNAESYEDMDKRLEQ